VAARRVCWDPLHRCTERLSQPLSRIAEPASVLLPGLILGDRGQMRTAHWETLRRTGTTHLMAISGLHVGLVAGLAFWVAATAWRATGRLMLWWPAPYAGATAALCAAAAYALMAGLSVATQRALIMRSLPPGRSLAVALWLILLLDPMTVLEPGFWLSFLGAGSILFALATAPGPRRWRLWLRVQLMLGLVLAPATLAYFGQVSLLSPLANLLAIPVVGVVVVPTALVASLVLVWGDPWGAGSLLLELAAWVLNHLWPILEWLAGRGFAAWSAPRPSWWAVLGATCAMLWWWLPLPAGIRSLAVIWLLPVLIKAPDNPADGAFRATFLDVGQGLAVVVETRSHVLLYDTGPRYSEQFDAGGGAGGGRGGSRPEQRTAAGGRRVGVPGRPGLGVGRSSFPGAAPHSRGAGARQQRLLRVEDQRAARPAVVDRGYRVGGGDGTPAPQPVAAGHRRSAGPAPGQRDFVHAGVSRGHRAATGGGGKRLSQPLQPPGGGGAAALPGAQCACGQYREGRSGDGGIRRRGHSLARP
jgi:ComEC/Rec2-related protein